MCSNPLSLKLYVACYVDNADLVISRVATVNSLSLSCSSLSVHAAHNSPQEVKALLTLKQGQKQGYDSL